ncbi:MAG: NRDE family protein [Kurthia sp.]|nr:NRDE family protein [Candidatus Kurthia equi]
MCIITLVYKVSANKPLVVVANRDEFYERPAMPAYFWQEDKQVIGGKDLEKMGSWLAIHKNHRFAAVTNYRDFTLNQLGEKSRGFIVNDFILGNQDSQSFLEKIKQEGSSYGPMNVIVYDGSTMAHYNNVTDSIQEMQPGIHCVTNATLNTPWPKAERMKQLVAARYEEESVVDLLEIGKDIEKPTDARLPSTGIPIEMERELSSIFVKREDYGTRCTTALQIDRNGQIDFAEQSYEKGMPSEIVHEKF